MRLIHGTLALSATVLGLAVLTTVAQEDKAPAKVTKSGDWPRWGRTLSNNMAGDFDNIPSEFKIGDFIGTSDDIKEDDCVNVKWIAKLGSQSYGNPTVADGRVYVGTNNDAPRDERFKGDRSCVYAFDEETGKFIWEFNIPKLGAGKVSDWEFLGICSSPTIDGDRAYVVTNLCEIACLDIHGMTNGNQGFQDEGAYFGGRGKPAMEVKDTDADIIWVYDMIGECGVSPHNVASSSVLVIGDRVWATTSNGVDYGHRDMPNPQAPSLIVLDKNTGELLGEENSGLGERTMHCSWSSPAYLKNDKLEMAVYGGPDGRVYAYAPEPYFDEEEEWNFLKEIWRYDVNRPEYREKDGVPVKYATRNGPSEIIASPVIYKDRVYALIGQDPEHGDGVGNLVCIDPTKEGDITESGKIWEYSDIHRSISTPSIVDDLVFVADYAGFIYCVDAMTGKLHSKYDTMGHIWGSTLVADGKVFIGNEDGYLTILSADKKMEKLAEIYMNAPIYSSAIAANGVLYVATQTHLFAIAEGAKLASQQGK